jgi:hypothetical protein
MASPYLNAALDGTDIGINRATLNAHTLVARTGDRRTFVPSFPTGDLTYMGRNLVSFPRTYLDTDTFPSLAGLTVRTANSDATLASAITAAGAAGTPSIIVIDNTVEYNSPIAFPVRAGDALPGGDNVVVLISKAIYDSLPGGGSWASTVMPLKVRATLADTTAHMARFINLSLANETQITFDGASKGWRFIGCYFGMHSTVATLSRLVRVGNGDTTIQTSEALCPSNVVFDRCGFDGNAIVNLKAALEPHCKAWGVQECYFGEGIHDAGQDCKAISSYNGPGPCRIVNNTLVAATENVLFGGAGATCGAPADAEVRWNEMYKPTSWNADHPDYGGVDWLIKNIFEVKKLQYGLIEGNWLHGCWKDGQAGAGFLLKSESYGDGGTVGYTHDLLVRWNLVEDVQLPINIAGVDNTDPAFPPDRVVSYGNLYKAGAQYYDIEPNSLFASGWQTDCASVHDTFVCEGTINDIAQPVSSAGLIFLDTIFGPTTYGFKGVGQSQGTATFATYCAGYDVVGCVFTGVTLGDYPASNFAPANVAAIEFNADYSLNGTTQTGTPRPLPSRVMVLFR